MAISCFEQCAGFLRILNGKEALDQLDVQSESYELVKTRGAIYYKSADLLKNNNDRVAATKAMAPSFAQAGDFKPIPVFCRA